MSLDEINTELRKRDLPLIEVVDVGASELVPKHPPPYHHLLSAGFARLTGFEPNPDEFKRLPQNETRRYIQAAIGDGSETQLFITDAPGFTSTLKPNKDFLERIDGFAEKTRIVDQETLRTQRLDDLAEIESIDFFKIDIQGGELAAFDGAAQKLQNVLCLHTEVAFAPLYQDQPQFDAQHRFLCDLGLMFMGFHSLNRFAYTVPQQDVRLSRRVRRREMGQCVDGDAVYIPCHTRWHEMDLESLWKLLAILVNSYPAPSLSLHLLAILESRGENVTNMAHAIADHFNETV